MTGWPASAEELVEVQRELGRASPPPWRIPRGPLVAIGACFVCWGRGKSGAGARGDRGWASAVAHETVVVDGEAGGPYAPGLLALREGPLLEAAVRSLPRLPDVLLVDSTGRDHPRRAGLALHLGAVLGIPTVGATHRPLLAGGPWPADEPGAMSPLTLEGELVGYWVRTRPGTRPLAVHAAWRTDPEAAAEVVLWACRGHRAPEALRLARQAAREARARFQRRDIGYPGGTANGEERGVAELFRQDELETIQERAMELAHEHESDAGLRAALQLLAEAAGNLANKLPPMEPAGGG